MKNFKNEPPTHLHSREHGSTTFKQCGWCKHASGTHRFDYCIEGKCRLLKSYSDKIQWDTPCRLADASANEIVSIIKDHEYKLRELERCQKAYTKDFNGVTLQPPPIKGK